MIRCFFCYSIKLWGVCFSPHSSMCTFDYINSIRFFSGLYGSRHFIVSCRSGHSHDYDIVEGPIANDTVFKRSMKFTLH